MIRGNVIEEQRALVPRKSLCYVAVVAYPSRVEQIPTLTQGGSTYYVLANYPCLDHSFGLAWGVQRCVSGHKHRVYPSPKPSARTP
jgi:hypothetical protein